MSDSRIMEGRRWRSYALVAFASHLYAQYEPGMDALVLKVPINYKQKLSIAALEIPLVKSVSMIHINQPNEQAKYR